MSKSISELIQQGITYPFKFLGGRMDHPNASVDQLKPGEGAVVEMNGKKVAAFKDPAGKVILHTAVCSHLGCIVKWNGKEKTFDCPCHGSRYHADGSLLNGPAQRGLDPIQK